MSHENQIVNTGPVPSRDSGARLVSLFVSMGKFSSPIAQFIFPRWTFDPSIAGSGFHRGKFGSSMAGPILSMAGLVLPIARLILPIAKIGLPIERMIFSISQFLLMLAAGEQTAWETIYYRRMRRLTGCDGGEIKSRSHQVEIQSQAAMS